MAQTENFSMILTSDQVGKPESVTPGLAAAISQDTPLLNAVSPNLNNLSAPIRGTTHKYYEEQSRSKRTTLSTSINSSITTLVLATAVFKSGEFIVMDEEVIKLGNTSNNKTFTDCVRAQWNTSAAAHVAGMAALGMDTPQTEGAPAGDPDLWVEPDEITTYAANLRQDIQCSKDALKQDQHWRAQGLTAYDLRLNKAMIAMRSTIENLLLMSYAQARSGDTTPGRFNGIYQRLASGNMSDLSNEDLDSNDLDDALQAVYDYESEPDLLLVNSRQGILISKWGLPYIQITPEEATTFGVNTKVLEINGTRLYVIAMKKWHRHPHCALLSSKHIRVGLWRDFEHEFLGLDGDRVKGQLVGSPIVEIACPGAHWYWTSVKTGLSTQA
jgi:hypothetical protein